jgi:hypothetical protein
MTGSVARPVSEGFRHCCEHDVTEGRSVSWYIDLDEGNLEDEITLGPIRNVIAVGIAGANGRTISGNISSRIATGSGNCEIATGSGNCETYASPLPSVDLARQEPSNYG